MRALLNLLLRRFLGLLVLMAMTASASFLLVRLAPGDFLTEATASERLSEHSVSSLRERYRLNQPWQEHYWQWWKGILRGDLGYSFVYHRPVSEMVGERIFNTSVLALTAFLLTLAASVPSGLLAGSGNYPGIDRLLSTLSLITTTLPSLILALLAMLFAAWTGVFPLGGTQSMDFDQFSTHGKVWDYLYHLALPSLVLALRQIPIYFRHLRSSMSEILTEDYISTARAKGASESRILTHHALRNAVNPLLTIMGSSLGSLFSGAFIVETVMSWPGLGSLTLSSLLSRDLYVVTACLLYTALLLALGNLAADLLLAAADPRIRRDAAQGAG